MKRESWFTLLSGFFLALLVSFSCTACIASAFDLHIESTANAVPVNLRALLALCALSSLYMSIFHTWKLGLCAILTLCLLFVYHWFFGDLKLSLEALCNAISKRYNNVYGWGELRWSDVSLSEVDKTLALQILAAPICAAVTWTVCRRQELVWALAAAILPIIPCTFITSTVPDAKFLGLWITALVLLFLTQASRKRSAQQGNRMLLILALPVTLAVVLLFHFAPQEGYDGKETADALLQKMQALFSLSGSGGASHADRDSIELSTAGNMRQYRVPVMTVHASESRTYYLRGRAYDTYTGLQWTDSGKNYELPWNSGTVAVHVGTISIETRYLEDVVYYPYASISAFHQPLVTPSPSYSENEDGLTGYTFDIYALSQSQFPSTDEQSLSAYTTLPQHTFQWANALISEQIFTDEDSISQDVLVRRISSYVKSSAKYNLKTPRMAADYDDFAQWFLEESDTGYCVHFATAATVLLRAAGVPARYVTGYAVNTKADEDVTVYELDAHAWVEYWVRGRGWLILDPTPAAEGSSHSSTLESSTKPTEPTHTTEPSETTAPSTSKRPTDATPTPATEIESSSVCRVLKYMLLVLLPLTLIWAQWKLRVCLRRRARGRGSAKKRVLTAWRHSLQYSRVLGQTPDRRLRRLAEKAKFSPYTPEPQELREFEAYFHASIATLRTRSVWKRIYARIILALY